MGKVTYCSVSMAEAPGRAPEIWISCSLTLGTRSRGMLLKVSQPTRQTPTMMALTTSEWSMKYSKTRLMGSTPAGG